MNSMHHFDKKIIPAKIPTRIVTRKGIKKETGDGVAYRTKVFDVDIEVPLKPKRLNGNQLDRVKAEIARFDKKTSSERANNVKKMAQLKNAEPNTDLL